MSDFLKNTPRVVLEELSILEQDETKTLTISEAISVDEAEEEEVPNEAAAARRIQKTNSDSDTSELNRRAYLSDSSSDINESLPQSEGTVYGPAPNPLFAAVYHSHGRRPARSDAIDLEAGPLPVEEIAVPTCRGRSTDRLTVPTARWLDSSLSPPAARGRSAPPTEQRDAEVAQDAECLCEQLSKKPIHFASPARIIDKNTRRQSEPREPRGHTYLFAPITPTAPRRDSEPPAYNTSNELRLILGKQLLSAVLTDKTETQVEATAQETVLLAATKCGEDIVLTRPPPPFDCVYWGPSAGFINELTGSSTPFDASRRGASQSNAELSRPLSPFYNESRRSSSQSSAEWIRPPTPFDDGSRRSPSRPKAEPSTSSDEASRRRKSRSKVARSHSESPNRRGRVEEHVPVPAGPIVETRPVNFGEEGSGSAGPVSGPLPDVAQVGHFSPGAPIVPTHSRSYPDEEANIDHEIDDLVRDVAALSNSDLPPIAPAAARRRRCEQTMLPRISWSTLITVIAIVAAFVILIMFFAIRAEDIEALKTELTHLQMHVKMIETKYQVRQQVMSSVQDYVQKADLSGADDQALSPISPQAAALAKNLTAFPHTSRALSQSKTTRMRRYVEDYPAAFKDAHSTAMSNVHYRPAFNLRSQRNFVDVVIGIPSIQREKESYLPTTLKYLIEGLREEDYNTTLIVVMVGEVELERVVNIAKTIEINFKKELNDGLIEVISPEKTFYPDLASLPVTLGDPPKRVQWRTKQNLDAIFLMSYSKSRALFYLMLEDDVITKPNYMQDIKSFAAATTMSSPDWLLIEYCRVGGIGKLFKTPDMAHFKAYVELFYVNMPFDWLIDSYVANRACGIDKVSKDCDEKKAKIRFQYKTSLFQHIGLYSSLKGKIQKIKDPKFGKLPLFVPHKNPAVSEIKISMEERSGHTIKDAYEGKSFFWGITPRKDDFLEFIFRVPAKIKSFTIRTGNYEHLADIFKDTDVLAKAVGEDVYTVVGSFNPLGVAAGQLPDTFGPVTAVKILVNANSDKWVIVTEIIFVTEEPKS